MKKTRLYTISKIRYPRSEIVNSHKYGVFVTPQAARARPRNGTWPTKTKHKWRHTTAVAQFPREI